MRALLSCLLLCACAAPADGLPRVLLDPDALDLGPVYVSGSTMRSIRLADLREDGSVSTVESLTLEGQGADWLTVTTEAEIPGPLDQVLTLDVALLLPDDAPIGPYAARLIARGDDGINDFQAESEVTFTVRPCDADGDGDDLPICGGGDCDDTDPLRSTLAAEICNGIDDDCNDIIDDTPDADLDGFDACEDCDDSDPRIFPGALERCNDLDDDCDGSLGPLELDGDGDGFSVCAGDCDDLELAVFPGALELCNGIDDDCDGVPDDREDDDRDGFSVCDDCDDVDRTTFPGAPELCDGLDNDCDGLLPVDESDVDGDGVAACEADCDDADPSLFPGNTETCNGRDDNCDEVIDEVGACPCTRIQDLDDIYLFCNTARTWVSAQRQCTTWNYHLLTVNNATEDAFALETLRDINDGVPWWMGFNDRTTEGLWEWEDGSTVRYTNWEREEPNDLGGEDCGELNFFEEGTWNDHACTLNQPYICELD